MKSRSKKNGDKVVIVKAVVDIGGVGKVSGFGPSSRLNGQQKIRIPAGTQGILLPSAASDEPLEVLFDHGDIGVAQVKVNPGEVAQI